MGALNLRPRANGTSATVALEATGDFERPESGAGTTRAAPVSLSAPMKNKSRQSLSLALSEGPPCRLRTRYYIHPADGLERPRFVLAVLEFAFLIDAHPPEGLIASFPATTTGVKREL
jgi:hypothetical protein